VLVRESREFASRFDNRASERRPGVADLQASITEATGDTRPVVVYLEAPEVDEESALRARGLETRPGRARMDQRNEAFAPHVLAVDIGSSVEFPNNDRTFHNVFSLSKTRKFDLGRYGQGKSKTVRFERPGVVRVFCDIHSHMNAFILVFNHPFHDTADASGRYRIDGIPPGTYTVNAWHDGAVRDTRTVTIPPAGGPTDLDLAVR
jgi:plastocyanin